MLATLSQSVLTLGGEFRQGGDWRKDRLCFRWEGYEFSFKIEEGSSRQPIPPGKHRSRTGSRFDSDVWRLVPTGKLTLDGRGPGYEQLSLRDGKTPIEERLEEIVERMYELIVGQREEDRIKAVREERAVAHLQKMDERRRQQEFEERRRKQLHIEARQYRQAQALRQYIDGVERAGFLGGGSNFQSLDAWTDWVSWSKACADSLDPLTSNRAGIRPAYPEPREITEYPAIYLRFDDPEEAEEEMKRSPWGRY